MSNDLYARIAPYYDLLHASLTEDIDFILSLAAQSPGPILELGCGTGRLLLPVARAGYQVTGVDSSAAMLARARKRLAELPAQERARVQLVAADMTRLAMQKERYGLALIPYNTFLHLPAERTVPAARAAHRHLQADGRLFLDMINPALAEQAGDEPALSLQRTVRDENGMVLVFASSRVESAAQVLHITWVYDRSPAAGGPVQRTVSELAYYYYYPHQIELLLQDSGFVLEHLFGNYERAPYSEESERLLVIARRR